MQKLLLLAYAVAAERISANDVKDADTWDADREHVYKKLVKSNIQQRATIEKVLESCTRQRRSPEFVRREVLPTVDYLKQLGIADARGAHASVRKHGFALLRNASWSMNSQQPKKRPSQAFLIAFYCTRTGPSLLQKLPLKARAKLVKVHAMASSPFATTIFMDFDSRPCSPHS